MTEFLLYLYAESPVHTGAAGSLDVLDLPVQREAATGYPVIWGQSLKGALRQAAGDAEGRRTGCWRCSDRESTIGRLTGARRQVCWQSGTRSLWRCRCRRCGIRSLADFGDRAGPAGPQVRSARS